MKSLYTILFSLLVLNLSAQTNQLQGKITNSKTNEAIRNVTVFIPDYQRGTTTNDEGQFSFNDLRTATIKLQITCLGYRSQLKLVDLSKESTVAISLEPSEMELQEVVVTSNNTSLSENIPYAVQTISTADLKKTGSITMMQSLSTLPGVDQISLGNGIGKPVIRGLSFNRLLLYGQGTRIENQQWDDHHDLGISELGVENVEIVRGPAALIYGADALGGALIFKDEKPAQAGNMKGVAHLGFNSNTLGLNGDVGIKKMTSHGLFYGINLGGNSQTSYVQGEEENKVKVNEEEEEFAANSKMMNMGVKANVGVSKKWGVSKFTYSYYNQQIGIIEQEPESVVAAGGDEEEQRDREMEAPYQDVTTQIVSLENTIILKKSKINLNVAYQLNDRSEYEPLANKQKEKAIGLKLNVATYDAKWTSDPEKKFGITIGSQGTFLKNENNGLEALVPDATVNDFAGFGLVRYDTKKVNLLGGIRVDARSIEAESYEPAGEIEADTFTLVRNGVGQILPKSEVELDKEYTPLSFSIGGALHLTKEFTIKLNGATGFSAPNYAALGTFGKHEGTYRFERGNMQLDVEQNIEGDLGLSWENDFISIGLSAYVNKVQNYIYIENTGDTMVRSAPNGIDTLPLYDFKQGDAMLTGGEFTFDFHPKSAKWIDVCASYSMVKGTLDAGGNLPYIPAGKLISTVKLSKEKIGKLQHPYAAVTFSNYSKQADVTEYELATDGYSLLDLHLGCDFNMAKQKISLALYCTNILNTSYYNQLSLVKNIGVHDMGRNIGLQLKVPFGINK